MSTAGSLSPPLEHAAPAQPAVRQAVLILVQIPSHFAEMVRVADLLRASDRYEPVLLFMSPYAGSVGHLQVCRARGLATIAPDELHQYLQAERDSPSILARVRKVVTRMAASSRARVRDTRLALRRALRERLPLRFFRQLPSQLSRRLPILFLRRLPIRRAWRPARQAARRVTAAALAVLRRVCRWAGGTALQLFDGASRLFVALAGSSRRGLLMRVPTVPELTRAWRIPRLPASVVLVLASLLATVVRPLLLLSRPLLRGGALLTFGLAYRCCPRFLPPDIHALRFAHRLAPALLRARGVRLLVIPEDNFYYFTNVFVRAVHDEGGRAVVVPFTIVNTLEWAEAFYRLPSYNGRTVVNLAMSFLFPRWRHEHKGTSLVMPPQRVLANEYLRIAPPIPWLINSGHSDAVAVESRFMERYYRTAGLPAHRLRLIGSLADDVLFRQLEAAADTRRRLYAELELPADRPMILCALPPNQLAGAGRPECEFDDYESVIRAFLAPLEALTDEYNVVLALHPRATDDDVALLEGLHARRATWGIAELVPLCRLFVASCSATIRLAITCGIPVVNYDVFVYGYDDYVGVPGVVTLSSHREYCEVLSRLARSVEEYEHTRRLQSDFARRETRLDGHAGERLLALFDEMSGDDARRHSAR